MGIDFRGQSFVEHAAEREYGDVYTTTRVVILTECRLREGLDSLYACNLCKTYMLNLDL
jgi:hypothetical protein